MKAVREIPPPLGAAAHGPPPIFQSFPRPFWMLILANAIFSLGNSSDSFLILRSGELGLGSARSCWRIQFTMLFTLPRPLRWAVFQIAPAKPVIATGWLMYALVYAGFSIWNSSAAPVGSVGGLWPVFRVHRGRHKGAGFRPGARPPKGRRDRNVLYCKRHLAALREPDRRVIMECQIIRRSCPGARLRLDRALQSWGRFYYFRTRHGRGD